MTDTKAGVSSDRQLQGKSNFIGWTRDFERAAKAKDVFDLLNGEEKILDEPQEETYLNDGPQASRFREIAQFTTPDAETPNSTLTRQASLKKKGE